MRHIRIDNNQFGCGLGPKIPEGDDYVYQAERSLHHTVNCPGCAEFKEPFGTPLSQVTREQLDRMGDEWRS